MFYKLVVLVFRFYFFFLINIKVIGMENIPSKSAAILASNHPSVLDGPLLSATIRRRLYPFAKMEVFNSRIKRWFLKGMGGIPVQLEKFTRTFVIETEKKLNDNNLLLIFPEGKVNEDIEIDEFSFGFVKLAQRYEVPIIPITIRGTENSISKNHKFPKLAEITVIISTPIKSEKEKLNVDDIKNKADAIKEIIQTNYFY